MSKQANKTLVGGFVVGAVALVVAGILIFGSGRLLTERPTFVMYFKGSVQGLNVGSPVVFRGVKVGSVTDILMRFDADDMSIQIPVVVELGEGRVNVVNVEALPDEAQHQDVIAELINRGLRAQLQLQSLITGQLLVELDFHPGTPVKLVGVDTEYPEIPTIQSDLEQFSKRVEKLPIEQLVSKLTSAIEGIERAVNSPELAETMSTMNLSLKDVQKLVRDIDSQIAVLAPGIEETMKDAQRLLGNVDSRVVSLASSIEEASEAARDALHQADETLSTVQGVVADNSQVPYHLTKTLKELSAAARSVRALTDYLNQYPDALLRGKGEAGGE